MLVFFFNDTATTEIYTLSLHDALPIYTEYAGTRGWSAEAMAEADADLVRRGLVADGALTEQGRRLRDGIEQQTEAALAPVLAAIGPELPALTRQLDEWSAAIVTGGAAPPDVYKRISGCSRGTPRRHEAHVRVVPGAYSAR